MLLRVSQGLSADNVELHVAALLVEVAAHERDEALEAFRQWELRDDKIEY
jgi:hypothetical protein